MSAEMSAEYTSFGLAPAVRTGGVLADGAYQVHRDFVDFIVDGRPLLHRLADLDAVSPLASDVPPSLFGAHVRRLLLETGAQLDGGRYVIYGCPECEGLDCGAVTAVIERAGPDFVWRDFAWQTDERVDLDRNGYRGLGPFRFRGDEYRAALGHLLTETEAADESEPLAQRRVLLIGARAAVLTGLANALRIIGIGADVADGAAFVPAEELRAYGAVAFGRGVAAGRRDAVRAAFDAAGVEVAYVDGLAPVTPLLVAQIEEALDHRPAPQRRLTGLTATGGAAEVRVTSSCRVRLTAYRLDRLHRTRTTEVFDAVLEPGLHRVPLEPGAVRGEAFVVARTMGGVLAAPVVRRPG